MRFVTNHESQRPIFSIFCDNEGNYKSSTYDNNLKLTITERAASDDSRRKYAAGHTNDTDFETTYGVVQYTPDFSDRDCNNLSIGEIQDCCNAKIDAHHPPLTQLSQATCHYT
ncbi:unnamed protein product [Sphenostylis stenocarpa]|uniref:Uncharacterized protein n=1 Tax=Sphenostylis stenocarpa TaxID=92480 RepID=A0AA86W2L6_9FABA|nr:unnamed protein product [Sphenostylis stenocarpa]